MKGHGFATLVAPASLVNHASSHLGCSRMPSGLAGIPPFLSSRHQPHPFPTRRSSDLVLNRAADIFRMAGHMLGKRLLLFLLHRGLVVDVVSSDLRSSSRPRGTLLASSDAARARYRRDALPPQLSL